MFIFPTLTSKMRKVWSLQFLKMSILVIFLSLIKNENSAYCYLSKNPNPLSKFSVFVFFYFCFLLNQFDKRELLAEVKLYELFEFLSMKLSYSLNESLFFQVFFSFTFFFFLITTSKTIIAKIIKNPTGTRTYMRMFYQLGLVSSFELLSGSTVPAIP